MSTSELFEKVDGFTESGIHYRVTKSVSSAEALVLLYGYGGNIGMWPSRFIERLAEDFLVITLDNRGVGQSISPKSADEYSAKLMAKDVDDVVKKLHLTRFHLLGYSLGGCIALQYASEHADAVKSLFLLSTTGGGKLWANPTEDHSAAFSTKQGATLWEMYASAWRTTMSDETMTKYDSVLKELFDNSKEYITSNEALAGHVRAIRTFDSSQILNKLSMPVTIFSGQDDRLLPIQNSINLALALPQAKLIKVPRCQHYPHVEAQDLLISEIKALRASVSSS